MRISKDSIERLKEQVDIVDIISSYIDLKRTGSNFSACCPFHDEKTPSFMVSPSKNIFHCYGCGVGGDSIGFVMQYEKLDFAPAVERIAEMSNFKLQYENNFQKKPQSTLLEDMARFYQQQLHTNPQMLDYLHNRGISHASIESFRLGFSPQSFESMKFINAHHINNKQEALELGIIGKDEAREYARFSQRIMFPIHSPNGKIVGFGGRSVDSQAMAKYINSPQSKIFNKSKLLYGYHIAKESIYREKKIIVCEGYIDVIMLHQAGFRNAVATLGTALSSEHIPLLKKGDPQIILSYDGDKAGINAAFRAAKMLSAISASGGVVIFSNNLDPADMVAQNKLEELKSLFTTPVSFIEFVLEQIIIGFNLSDPLQKQQALNEITAFTKTLTPLLQAEYVPFIAQRLRIAPNLIKIHRQNTKQAPILTQDSQKHLAESVLIRTLLENPEWITIAVEYLEPNVFECYNKEYLLVLQSQDTGQDITQNPYLRPLLINENIKKLQTLQEFKEHLKILVLKAYKRDLALIPRLNLRTKQKLESINTLKGKIAKLTQGELISYEKSISTL
ncbi:DNA primase [uncultured Helicobacter sp.]|uniref:DNA primase n=1 Tax=uncultured Helicobacter sp. TaxID=175537 RepID=UPI00374F4AEE